MKKEYAEAYVRWSDTNAIDLDMLSLLSVIYGIFSCVILGLGAMAHRLVLPSIIFALFLAHCILTAALKQRYCELTYYQKFLNIGGSSLFIRVVFLLISLSPLELSQMYGDWYYLLVIGVWLLVNILDFGAVWWRIQSGRFYAAQERKKEQEKQKKTQRKGMSRGPATAIFGIGGLAGILGMVFAKKFFSHVSQVFVVNFLVWSSLLVGLVLGIAASNLWKAYYVKKYDIQGKSIPAYTPRPGQKQTVLHSILRTLGILGRILLILIAFSVGVTLIVSFIMSQL